MSGTCSLCLALHCLQGGGEFRGENFAVKKGGEIFPWRNFGVTVPSFTTAAGIVFPEQGQARLRTRLCQPFAAQMHESDDQVSGAYRDRETKKFFEN